MNAWRLVVCLCVLGASAPAQAFVCTRAVDTTNTANGPSLSWRTRLVPFTLQSNATAQLNPNDAFSVLRAAFLVWQNLTLDPNSVAQCGGLPGTDLKFTETTPSAVTWVGYNFLDPNNNNNLLVFRDTVWNSDPNATDIIALTTTTYSALTGEIIDADIEFNSAQYTFVVNSPGPMDMDLLNTAVHEVGHFLGLAHCATAGTCGHQEVMEPTSNYAEIQKRALKCDDRAGIVFKYPLGAANQYCDTTADATCGGCAPPNDPNELPSVNSLSHSTGRSSCQAAPMGLLTPLLCVLGLMRKRRRIGYAAVVLMALSACDGSECNGQIVPTDPHAPLITAMAFLESVPADPWRVILATDFVDIDGDLGTGTANFYTGTQIDARSSVELAQVFSASGGVSPTATSGRIALLVRFAQSTVSGSVLRLGTQLVDASGRTSNCYSLNLSFALQSGTVP